MRVEQLIERLKMCEQDLEVKVVYKNENIIKDLHDIEDLVQMTLSEDEMNNNVILMLGY